MHIITQSNWGMWIRSCSFVCITPHIHTQEHAFIFSYKSSNALIHLMLCEVRTQTDAHGTRTEDRVCKSLLNSMYHSKKQRHFFLLVSANSTPSLIRRAVIIASGSAFKHLVSCIQLMQHLYMSGSDSAVEVNITPFSSQIMAFSQLHSLSITREREREFSSFIDICLFMLI